MGHHTKTDTEYRKTEKHQVHHIHDVFLLSFFRSIHGFNVNLKRDDFIRPRLIMFNGHQRLSITTHDLPPAVRPLVQFTHADTPIGVTVRVSGAGGRYPSALCGRCVL